MGIVDSFWFNWEHIPTFLVGEFLFISLSFVALVHALTRKDKYLYLTVWIASIVSGCANDIFFMTLPFVDNFWHSQATIMLTDRLPLYILCLYNVFMYYSTVSVWQLNLSSKLVESLLIGLFAELIYSPFDIVGAKFLWWTWHDTDVAIRERLLGVPIGSSLWVIVFTTVFSYLIHRTTSNNLSVSFFTMIKSVIINALLCTPGMLVLIAIFQIPSVPGIPDLKSLLFCLGVYLSIIIYRFIKGNQHPKPKSANTSTDIFVTLLKLSILIYFIVLAVIMAVGQPEKHISIGIHQTVGPCDVIDYDLSGHPRQLYLCLDQYIEDYSFDCTSLPIDYQEWYTVCGRPHTDFNRYLATVCLLGAAGIFVYSHLLKTQISELLVKKKK